MDDAFAESLVHRASVVAGAGAAVKPPPLTAHCVLRRRLRPLCLWHHFALDVFRSPYVGHSGVFDLSALDIAARACAASYPKLIVPAWRSSIGGALLQYRFGRFFDREHVRFLRYMLEYAGNRPVFGRTKDSQSLKTPWYHVAMLQLLRDTPQLTEAEAWMMPINTAQWRLASAAEGRGESILLETEADRIAQREAAAK